MLSLLICPFASLIAGMRFTTRSSISGSCITTSWLTGFGCLLDGLRVFILTASSNGSASGPESIVAFALALVLALGFGPITSGGVVSLF